MPTIAIAIALLLALGIVAGAWYLFESRWDRSQFRERSEKDFSRNVRAGMAGKLLHEHPDLIVIDVRPFSSFEAGHLPGALNAPFSGESLDSSALAGIPRDRPVLVYCDGGYRSRKALPSVRDSGFHSIYHLHRGLMSWKAAKGLVETGTAT